MSKPKTAITPTREENYPEWYQQVVKAADLAENSAVRGCMVIKPWGYAIWENMQRALDGMFKATGHENAYFPLFIPLSLPREGSRSTSRASRRSARSSRTIGSKPGPDGKLVPAGRARRAADRAADVARRSSAHMFAKWVQSYRDLPLLINQWANVVRWEMRTRLFLRTTEFLWQEGHTAHATARGGRRGDAADARRLRRRSPRSAWRCR